MTMKSETPKEASERLGKLREAMQRGVTEVTTGQIQPVRDVAVQDAGAEDEAQKYRDAERDPVVIRPEGADEAIAAAGGEAGGEVTTAPRAARGRPKSTV